MQLQFDKHLNERLFLEVALGYESVVHERTGSDGH